MKQTNLKVALTGLTISACMLVGSACTTVKTGNSHSDSIQNQEAELQVIDTKYRVELAREQQSIALESSQLLDTIPLKLAWMSVQIPTPVEKIFSEKAKITAEIAKEVPLVKTKLETVTPVKPKTIVQTTPKAQAKKVVLNKSSKQVVTEVSKKVSSVPKKEATPKIAVSARKVAAAPETHTLEISDGKTIEYSRLIPVKATAYTAAAEENGSWGAFDFFGNPLKLGTIAVDPDVIPMGSTVYITGYSFDGLPNKGMIAKATDQGGSVQGKRIDIFVPTSKADATKFGMQDVKIYIIE